MHRFDDDGHMQSVLSAVVDHKCSAQVLSAGDPAAIVMFMDGFEG